MTEHSFHVIYKIICKLYGSYILHALEVRERGRCFLLFFTVLQHLLLELEEPLESSPAPFNQAQTLQLAEEIRLRLFPTDPVVVSQAVKSSVQLPGTLVLLQLHLHTANQSLEPSLSSIYYHVCVFENLSNICLLYGRYNYTLLTNNNYF